MRSVGSSVFVLKKPGSGENTHSVFEGVFCANVYFEAKLIEVVVEEGDPSLDVGPLFKNKYAVIYIEHA